MGNYYSYMRISTKEERQKQKYARQEKALEKYAENKGIDFFNTFKEDASGKNFDRPAWNKLEKGVHSGDTIVLKDISRFTRQAEEGYEKYMELMNKGVNLVFLDNPTVSTTYIKKMMGVAEEQALVAKTALEGTIKLLLIVELDRVEQERLTLIQRTKDGIAASEKTSGRPKGTLDKMSTELRGDVEKFLEDRTIKQVDLMEKHKISRNTLKKYAQLIKEEQDQMKG